MSRQEECHESPPITIQPLEGQIGAEIGGLDIAQIDPTDVEVLRAAFQAHHLLVFRGVSLTGEQQRRFGALLRPRNLIARPQQEDGADEPARDGIHDDVLNLGEVELYLDELGEQTAAEVVLLYAVDGQATRTGRRGGGPRSSGEALASSMLAYDALPLEIRRLINQAGGTPAQPRASAREARQHGNGGRLAPGRTALDLMTLADEESNALLCEIFAYIANQEFAYTHEWRGRDLVVWNRAILKNAVTLYGVDGAGRLRRSVIR